MKKSLAAITLLILTLMLASCARIKTNVTVYNPSNVNLRGATYAYMMLDNQAEDPNYQYLSQLVDRQLQANGMIKSSVNPQFNVVIIYQLASKSPSHVNSLEVAVFTARTMYDLHSKPSYLVNVMSDGQPKDQNQNDILQHLVSDAFQNFPAVDGKTFSYPENY
ncbi:MAG: hypothetical protein K0S29_1471 [Gammaproteobacteria bacterium]|jgi:hypothetical protein|nr:hypothetical protein [Gammaproteobacteria bacterium]